MLISKRPKTMANSLQECVLHIRASKAASGTKYLSGKAHPAISSGSKGLRKTISSHDPFLCPTCPTTSISPQPPPTIMPPISIQKFRAAFSACTTHCLLRLVPLLSLSLSHPAHHRASPHAKTAVRVGDECDYAIRYIRVFIQYGP